MTIAQQLIEKGHLQGMEKGVEQGRQLGVEQATRHVLLRQLQQRFGAASREQLEVWVMRVLSAPNLADVFAA